MHYLLALPKTSGQLSTKLPLGRLEKFVSCRDLCRRDHSMQLDPDDGAILGVQVGRPRVRLHAAARGGRRPRALPHPFLKDLAPAPLFTPRGGAEGRSCPVRHLHSSWRPLCSPLPRAGYDAQVHTNM